LAGKLTPVTAGQKAFNDKQTAMMTILTRGLAGEDADGELPPEEGMAAAERPADLVSPEAVDRMPADAGAAAWSAWPSSTSPTAWSRRSALWSVPASLVK
jgi:hypothetical protein